MFFLPVYMTQLGLSPGETSLIYGSLPFISAFTRIVMGTIADKLQGHRSILMILCVISGAFFMLLFLVAPSRDNCVKESLNATGALCVSQDNSSLLALCGNSRQWMVDEIARLECSNYCNDKENYPCLNITNVKHLLKSDTLLCMDGPRLPTCTDNFTTFHLDASSGHQCYGVQQDVQSEQQCDLDCRIWLECASEANHYDNTFWIVLVISLIAYSGYAPVPALMHAIVFSLLKDRRNSWGKQRYFGTIGFIIFVTIISVLMQRMSRGNNTDFSVNFVAYLTFTCLTALAAYFYKIPPDVKCGGIFHNLRVLGRDPHVLTLFGLVFFLGILLGAQDTFLLLYVKSLGANEMLLGISLVMNCIIEIPAMYFADVYLTRLVYSDNYLNSTHLLFPAIK